MTCVRRGRLLSRGAALATLALVMTACSGEGSSSSDTAPAGSAPGSSMTTTAAVPATVATTDVIVTTTVAIDAAAALQQGLAGLATGYHFTSTLSVNDVPSLVADGDRIGASSRLTLASDAATVAYVVTPEGSFARPDGGEWEQLDVAPATSDPMNALLAPSSVVHVPTGDGTTLLRVTVAAASLGIAVGGTVDVDVVILGGAIASITYRTPVEGGTATVVTGIGPVTDPTPIAPPI